MRRHRCSPIRRLFLLLAVAAAAAAAAKASKASMASRRRPAHVGGEAGPQPDSTPTWTSVDPAPPKVGDGAGPQPHSTPTSPTAPAKKATAKKATAKKQAATAKKAVAAKAWREPGKNGACPKGYPVKVAASGIFHVPGGRGYERTTPVRCYADAAAAKADGYRQAKA